MKKGISLIVLVITIIVLAILAAAVIVSVSPNNNVMDTASQATKDANLASAKSVLSMYVANNLDKNASGSYVVTNAQNQIMTVDAYNTVLNGAGLKASDYVVTVDEKGFVLSVDFADSGAGSGSGAGSDAAELASAIAAAEAYESSHINGIWNEQPDGLIGVGYIMGSNSTYANSADYLAAIEDAGLDASKFSVAVGSNGFLGGVWLTDDENGEFNAAKAYCTGVENPKYLADCGYRLPWLAVATAAPDDAGEEWYYIIPNSIPGEKYVINTEGMVYNSYTDHLTFGGFNASDYSISVNNHGIITSFTKAGN